MNELVRDPAPRIVPTKFDRDPIRTAPGRAVTVWGNAHPPARPAGDDNTPRAQFGLRGKKEALVLIGVRVFKGWLKMNGISTTTHRRVSWAGYEQYSWLIHESFQPKIVTSWWPWLCLMTKNWSSLKNISDWLQTGYYEEFVAEIKHDWWQLSEVEYL